MTGTSLLAAPAVSPGLDEAAQRFAAKRRRSLYVGALVFAGSVTGLDTLVSGSYIGMMPSTEKGKPESHFVGKEDPPMDLLFRYLSRHGLITVIALHPIYKMLRLMQDYASGARMQFLALWRAAFDADRA